MARKRMVSPDLLTSLKVARLPIAARYAWVALWMYVDDAGRGLDSPRLIRAHTWPLDDNYGIRKVTADLDLMVTEGLVCRYTDGQECLLHIPSWGEHQKINRPSPSRFRPCPTHEPEALALVSIHGGVTSDEVRAQ